MPWINAIKARLIVVITTAQLHSTKPELRFCADLNLVPGVSEIHDGEDLWQWCRLEIKQNAFRRSTIPQKQFIIFIRWHYKSYSSLIVSSPAFINNLPARILPNKLAASVPSKMPKKSTFLFFCFMLNCWNNRSNSENCKDKYTPQISHKKLFAVENRYHDTNQTDMAREQKFRLWTLQMLNF